MAKIGLRLKADRRVEFIAGAIILGLIGVLVWRGLVEQKKAPTETKPCYKKTLTLWTPFDKKVLAPLTEPLRPYCLTLKIETKPVKEIQTQLLRAIVAGTGPTITYVDADFLASNLDVFTVPIKQQQPFFTLNDYPQAISEIFKLLSPVPAPNQPKSTQLPPANFFAYPFTYDTLVLFWNKDLLQAAGLTKPPATFEAIQAVIPRLRRVDANNQITLSPIALGAANNHSAYFETFLALWKMQNPTALRNLAEVSRSLFTTLDFYTQFTNIQSDFFSWQPSLPDSRQMFLAEQTAMLIDFYSFKKEIKQKNPRLNFSVGPLPRLASKPKKTNYIQPYFLAVTKNNAEIGWLFLALMDKNYQSVMAKLGAQPIKIKVMANGDRGQTIEDQILFNELIVGDSFAQVDKEFVKASLKTDIENWLTDKRTVQQLISTKQASKFFRKLPKD